MTKELKKRAITPKELEAIYGIPRGSAANLRYQKRGPKYYKAGRRRVIYMVEDVEEIERKTILTRVVPELSDFKYGKSRWEVSAVDADHSRIRFSYEIQPDFWVPPLIGPYFIKRKLLAAARQTITRIEVLARDG